MFFNLHIYPWCNNLWIYFCISQENKDGKCIQQKFKNITGLWERLQELDLFNQNTIVVWDYLISENKKFAWGVKVQSRTDERLKMVQKRCLYHSTENAVQNFQIA